MKTAMRCSVCRRWTVGLVSVIHAAPLPQAVRDSIGEIALAYTSGEPQAHMGEFMPRKAARPR